MRILALTSLTVALSALRFARLAYAQLARDDFELLVQERDIVVVTFCVPWYEPCKAFSVEMEEVTKILDKKKIPVISFDCTKDKEFCRENEILSYPTIRLFEDKHKYTRYRGSQTAAAITSHVIKKTLPPISVLDVTSVQEIKSLDTAVLIAFADADEVLLTPVFTSLSESDDIRSSFLLGISSNSRLSTVSPTKTPFVTLFNPLDEVEHIFYGPFTHESIEKFAEESLADPLIGKFSLQSLEIFSKSSRPTALLFGQPSQLSIISRLLHPVAASYKQYINFVTVDTSKLAFLAQSVGLQPDSFPALAIQDFEIDETFPMPAQGEGFKVEDVGLWVEEFVANRNDARIRPIPKTVSHDEV